MLSQEAACAMPSASWSRCRRWFGRRSCELSPLIRPFGARRHGAGYSQIAGGAGVGCLSRMLTSQPVRPAATIVPVKVWISHQRP